MILIRSPRGVYKTTRIRPKEPVPKATKRSSPGCSSTSSAMRRRRISSPLARTRRRVSGNWSLPSQDPTQIPQPQHPCIFVHSIGPTIERASGRDFGRGPSSPIRCSRGAAARIDDLSTDRNGCRGLLGGLRENTAAVAIFRSVRSREISEKYML